MAFRSRYSVFLCLSLAIVFGTALAMSFMADDIIGTCTVAFVTVFVAVLFGCMRYVIDDKMLYVRSFPFTRGTAYDITKLQSITRTRSVLSAPACSLKRIKLDFGVGQPLIISPAEQELFFDEIRRINPEVKIDC